MKIAYIGTYPPRQCGIGTFTFNKFSAVSRVNLAGERQEGIVIAMNDSNNSYDYPEEVKFVVRQNEQADYLEAAKFVNESGADICILEHEYGIFGGDSGLYILSFLHKLQIPSIVVLHTVLKSPSRNEKNVVYEMSKMVSRIVVMSSKAISFLTDIYGIPRRQIELIPHGVPDYQFDQQECKQEFGLSDKKVLLTFGLISRKKGIETVIRALPAVVARHPDIMYLVLGRTHPAVFRDTGEEYRESLQALVAELHLEKHVIFLNEFADEERLCRYLAAADIYVTPYLSEAQITSGTLAYAVGAGCAVISTPYWHAEELLADGRGRIYDFNNHEQLSGIFMSLMDHPEKMKKLRENALAYGQETRWSKVSEKYVRLSQALIARQAAKSPAKKSPAEPVMLPYFSLDHISRMTDDTGLIQHAKFGIPNLKEGYCLDDNARALLMVVMANRKRRHPLAMKLLPVYLRFIHYMQNEDGSFRNFMSFTRQYLDQKGSEDSFGRTIWALGCLLGNSPMDAYYDSARSIFQRATPNFITLETPRGIANTIIGISYYLSRFPSDLGMVELVRRLSSRLIDDFDRHTTAGWKWFENEMTYDNAVLPLALFHAHSILDEDRLMQVAMESMNALVDVSMRNGHLSVIGNEGWFRKGQPPAAFAQQPVDAMMMVLMLRKAYEVTAQSIYLEYLYKSFMWFHGENDLRIGLYDQETRGCCDGLEHYGINRNQGAESTLAYLIAHLVTLQTVEETTVNGDAQPKNGASVSNVKVKITAPLGR